MKKIMIYVLVVALLFNYVNVFAGVSGAGTGTGDKIGISRYDYNSKQYSIAVFDTEAVAGSGTTYRTHGWNILYGSYSILYDVTPSTDATENYKIPLIDGTNLPSPSIESKIKSRYGATSNEYNYWMQVMKTGGTITFNARIQRYNSGNPSGRYADTLYQAQHLADDVGGWSSETMNVFQTDYYNRDAYVPAQPIETLQADFDIYNGENNITDNGATPIQRQTSNLVVNLVDNSNIENDIITKRQWNYWDAAAGWVKIPGQGINDTSLVVNSSGLGISPDRIGFQLVATSGTGIVAYSSHTVYSTYANGIASIIIHYKDDKGATLAPDNIVKTDLDKPTTIYSIPISNYKADKASDVVSVPSSDPDMTVEYTFTYTYSPASPPSIPPTVFIDSYDTVVVGNDITIKGSGTDPQNNPITYSWSVSPSSWMQGSLVGTSSTIWFNQVGTVTVTLTGTSASGTDTDTKQIRVLPPYPNVDIAVINAILNAANTRVNHKITLDASHSTSGSQRASIDWTKTVWELSVDDSTPTLTLNDIKTRAPYVFTTNTAGKPVMRITGDYKTVEILSKKVGKINVSCSITNDMNYSSTTTKQIDVLPDLPPLANATVTKNTLRDPNDNNYATIDITDLTTMQDEDGIIKRVWLYSFDSDNDGSNKVITRNSDGSLKATPINETWYVYHNDTWVPVTNFGISGSYTSLKNLDISLINSGNLTSLPLKVNHVGKYRIELIIQEDIINNTIPDFITIADIQKGYTFDE